jgi:hypothetical protein
MYAWIETGFQFAVNSKLLTLTRGSPVLRHM